MAKSFPDWQQAIAYPLVFSPILVLFFLPTACPPPHSSAIALRVAIGLGFSTSFSIFLRRPFNILGWLGLIVWGGVILLFSLEAIINWCRNGQL